MYICRKMFGISPEAHCSSSSMILKRIVFSYWKSLCCRLKRLNFDDLILNLQDWSHNRCSSRCSCWGEDSVVLNVIRMTIGWIVLQVNVDRLTESDFWYDVILSRWRPCRHFTQKSAAICWLHVQRPTGPRCIRQLPASNFVYCSVSGLIFSRSYCYTVRSTITIGIILSVPGFALITAPVLTFVFAGRDFRITMITVKSRNHAVMSFLADRTAASAITATAELLVYITRQRFSS